MYIKEILMTTTTFDQEFDKTVNDTQEELRPLPFWGSLIAFGAPALLMVFSITAQG